MAYDLYDDTRESRSPAGLVALVAIVLVCGTGLFFVAKYFTSAEEPVEQQGRTGGGEQEPEEVVRVVDEFSEPPDPAVTVSESSGEILESLGIGVTSVDAALLVEQIGRNLEAGEVRAAANIIGRKALSEAQLER
ncbi:MAG: hypothetical protein GWO24_23555, partial [Akkermansiaceae bacterium]|nr:hypothetical protein [Akkermansiaceae bacterium]